MKLSLNTPMFRVARNFEFLSYATDENPSTMLFSNEETFSKERFTYRRKNFHFKSVLNSGKGCARHKNMQRTFLKRVIMWAG